MNFKGFDDWIEIFKGGKQIDSEGRTHDGDEIIRKAVAGFSSNMHEPPLVVGHPKDNSPAFGWVESLKTGAKNGVNVLYAKFKDVVPEFGQAVSAGLYKKRSASFYPDGTLRHVGFLGGMPPAVKGLANLKFKDDGEAMFEFSSVDKDGRQFNNLNNNTEAKKMTFKDFVEAFKFWKQVEDNAGTGFPASPAAGTKTKEEHMDKQFSEEDIEKAKKESAKKAKEDAIAEFAEKKKKEAAEQSKKRISGWVEKRVKEGKLLPSWTGPGLTAFMAGLDADTQIEFAEGADKKSPLKYFQDMLDDLGKSPIFVEMATKARAGDSAEFAEAKKDQELGESMAAKVNPPAKS